MSLARTAVAAVARPAVVSRRAFSSSPAALLATPQTGPTEVGRAPRHADQIRNQRQQQALQTPDYSHGPSALDKAAGLFFFSEIVRGMGVVLEQVSVARVPLLPSARASTDASWNALHLRSSSGS